jgi:hypothetical protein
MSWKGLLTEYEVEKIEERITKHLNDFGTKKRKMSEHLLKYDNC